MLNKIPLKYAYNSNKYKEDLEKLEYINRVLNMKK